MRDFRKNLGAHATFIAISAVANCAIYDVSVAQAIAIDGPERICEVGFDPGVASGDGVERYTLVFYEPRFIGEPLCEIFDPDAIEDILGFVDLDNLPIPFKLKFFDDTYDTIHLDERGVVFFLTDDEIADLGGAVPDVSGFNGLFEYPYPAIAPLYDSAARTPFQWGGSFFNVSATVLFDETEMPRTFPVTQVQLSPEPGDFEDDGVVENFDLTFIFETTVDAPPGVTMQAGFTNGRAGSAQQVYTIPGADIAANAADTFATGIPVTDCDDPREAESIVCRSFNAPLGPISQTPIPGNYRVTFRGGFPVNVELARGGAPLGVEIEVEPFGEGEAIAPDADGLISVGVRTDHRVDARDDLLPSSVRFGPTGQEARAEACYDAEIAPFDGRVDKVCTFDAAAAGLEAGGQRGILGFRARDGRAFEGVDHFVVEGQED